MGWLGQGEKLVFGGVCPRPGVESQNLAKVKPRQGAWRRKFGGLVQTPAKVSQGQKNPSRSQAPTWAVVPKFRRRVTALPG